MFVNITEVIPGDVILEGGRTEVKKVDVNPVGCRNKVHINERDCYEQFTDVRIEGPNNKRKFQEE